MTAMTEQTQNIEQPGIAEYAATSKGILGLTGSTQEDDISSRAAEFRKAMEAARLRLQPDMEAIAKAPRWLALPLEAQTRLIIIIGTLANAKNLAISLDGPLLQQIAKRLGDTKLDEILQITSLTPKYKHQNLTFEQIESDGQAILLASVPPTLRPLLMAGSYFRLADTAKIALWKDEFQTLLEHGEAL
jgi:hypothetical protein